MTRVFEEQHEQLTSELTGFRWQRMLLEEKLDVLSYKNLLERIKRTEKADYEILLKEMRACQHILVESEVTNCDGDTIKICYCMKCPFDTGFIDALCHDEELTYLQRAQQQVYCLVFRKSTVVSKSDYDSELVREVYRKIMSNHPDLPDELAIKYVMAYLKKYKSEKNTDEFKARRLKRIGLSSNTKY